MTQGELANRLNITQAALSRYEHGLRVPDANMVSGMSAALGATTAFLQRGLVFTGGIAADAHMRRPRTVKPAQWKRVEVRLNEIRMHASYLLERVDLTMSNHVVHVDPVETTPAAAAQLLRATWRMPIGEVPNLLRWVESAGVIVISEDLGSPRINAMSQWAGECAVMVVNSVLPTDQKRMAVAHELGHLVLHTTHFDADAETQASQFADEFLLPDHLITHDLQNLSLGKLGDLKVKWGVPMQTLIERGCNLGTVTTAQRSALYRQLGCPRLENPRAAQGAVGAR